MNNNQKVYYEEDGTDYVLDENGNKIPPLFTTKVEIPRTNESSWIIYDTSRGHCAFCGKLGCREQCIQGGS